MLRGFIVFASSVSSFDQFCLLFDKTHPPSDIGLISVNDQFQFSWRQRMVTIFCRGGKFIFFLELQLYCLFVGLLGELCALLEFS